MSRRGNIRRSGGGGGGGSGGGIGLATPAELLGASLVLDLDSRFGASGQNWQALTGQTMLGTGNPVLASDGANFKGNPVWKFLKASTQRMESGVLPVLVPTGPQLYVSIIYRATLASGATFQTYLQLNDSAEALQAANYVTGVGTVNVFMTSNITASPPAFDQLVHRSEFFLDGAFGPGVGIWAMDSVGVTGTGGAQSFPANITRVAIAAASSAGNTPSDINIASIRVARIAPPFDPTGAFDPQRIYQQLAAYDRAVWGTV